MLKQLLIISTLSLWFTTALAIDKPDRLQSTATVLEHHSGKGRYEGMMGSMSVQNEHFGTFKIGVGFTKATRRLPPPINSTIEFSYSGITSNGLPKRPAYVGTVDNQQSTE